MSPPPAELTVVRHGESTANAAFAVAEAAGLVDAGITGHASELTPGVAGNLRGSGGPPAGASPGPRSGTARPGAAPVPGDADGRPISR